MNKIPPEPVLKSIIGKYVTGVKPVKYCHVDNICSLDVQNRTATAVVDIVTPNDINIKQTAEYHYTINDYGIYSVIAHKMV